MLCHVLKLIALLVVITLYSQTMAKNAKHSAVMKVNNIASVSNVGVQVFELVHRNVFGMISQRTRTLGTHHYQKLLSTSLLCQLCRPPRCTPSGIEIFEDDLQDFRALLKGEAQLTKAMKQFAKRGKVRAVQVKED